MRHGKGFTLIELLVATMTLGMINVAHTQSLKWLGTLPDPYDDWSTAWGVSADGYVAVGTSGSALCPLNFCSEAFVWFSPPVGGPDGLMAALWAPPEETRAWDVAENSTPQHFVAVGTLNRPDDAPRFRAVRWVNWQLEYLTAEEAYSEAYGVSADGSVVVGWKTVNEDGPYPFCWVEGLGIVNVLSYRGAAWDVSADGAIAVGYIETDGVRTAFRSFRWRCGVDEGTLVRLPPLLGYRNSEAYGVSDDGSVVVGWSYNESCDGRATRWVGTQPHDLGILESAGPPSVAYDVSADGTIVVGSSGDCPNDTLVSGRAFRWTQATGMQDLNEVYAPILQDSLLLSSNDISLDGCYIVGVGSPEEPNSFPGLEAFWLHAACMPSNGDVNRDGCVDDSDMLAVLFAIGQSCPSCPSCPEDLNCDGVVDDADLLIVLFNLGNGC